MHYDVALHNKTEIRDLANYKALSTIVFMKYCRNKITRRNTPDISVCQTRYTYLRKYFF